MTDEITSLRTAILKSFPASQLTRYSEADLLSLQQQFPEIPQHYLAFLRGVGWGSIDESGFSIYSGPVLPSDIYDAATAAELDGLLFIGDDFMGWMLGFDTLHNWEIIGLDSATLQPATEKALSITSFFVRWVDANRAAA